MMHPRPVVFVVDHEIASRTAVDRLVQAMNLHCQCYATGKEFLDKVDPGIPGCVLLEVRLPDINGLELHRRLRDRDDRLPVIFVDSQPSVAIAVRAMRGGAVHFIQKPFHDGELWDAIAEAVRLNEERRQAWAQEQSLRRRMAGLTEQERELIYLIMREKSSKAIASRLDVCVRTVELRRARLMKKLGVHSIFELMEIVMALRNAALKPTPQDFKGLSGEGGALGFVGD